MRRLSLPIEQLNPHYTAVIIGSGYGGGIAASRLSRAGLKVCVLERGRELHPGEYPDTSAEVTREIQAHLPKGDIGSATGLYDFHVGPDINVLVGCGLGGTSLINAGITIRPDARVFDDPRWPAALRADLRSSLEEGYRRSIEMLRPSTYPDSYPKLAKATAHEKSAAFLNAPFTKTPMHIVFKDGVSPAGIEQKACVCCGDCVTGCNYGSKSTTLMNYLPDAVNHGAEIFTEISVRRLERESDRWVIHYVQLESGQEKFKAPTMFITADLVVVAAGVLGSTELLLRSKAAGLSASDRVGRRFSGNGDALGYAWNCNEQVNGVGFGSANPADREPVGPFNTTLLDLRNTPNLEDGISVEEGAIPAGIAAISAAIVSAAAPVRGKDTDTDVADAVKEKKAELDTLMCGPYRGGMQNTQTYLIMSHDDGEGRMVLEDDRLRIHWPGVGGQPNFERVNQKLLDATRPLGGTFVPNPTWSKLTNQNLTTVHPLGGCVMAERAEDGVVNHKGQVFSGAQGNAIYDNLMVWDGSIIPRPLGINPLLTISALAERAVAIAAKDRGWTIDYSTQAALTAPIAAAQSVGLRFTETMKGHFSSAEKQDFAKGAQLGKTEGSSFQFILTITADDADKMLTDSQHAARAIGTVIAPKLSASPLTVREGAFQLFVVDPTRVETRNMIYRLKLDSEEGHSYFMHGVKLVHPDSLTDAWDDTTTLFITVHDGESDAAPVLGKGVLRILPQDFAVQMQTMEVLNSTDRKQQLEIIARFGQFFAGTLFDVYGNVAARPNRIDATKPPLRKKRPLRMKPPELYWVKTSDGVQVRLTRFAGGAKGPVMLTPGFGVSTLSFSTDTIDTNLPEYLYANGYDVWLLDYRASPDLPSSATAFTLDDIALRDYPAAVARIRQITGAPSIQVMAHCIGSMTFLMAMLGGLDGVRSAVCSQLGLFPVTSTLNEVKAGLKVGHFLIALGETTVNTNLPLNDWRNKLATAVIQMFPRQELCSSSVCHQVRLIYGESYKHDQLNAATHDALHEMFGVASIAAFNQILKTIQANHVVDKDGKDVYMPQIGRLKIPITFVQGADNQLFLPAGTRQTFRHLCEKNGPDRYVHIQFPHYAHMDLFVGKTAAQDIYPTLLGELEKYALDYRKPLERGVNG